MHFLPDVQVRCPVCQGRRFRPEVLAITYRGHDIADVLDLTIEEALALFHDVPAVAARLSLMSDVGWATSNWASPPTPSQAAKPSVSSWPKS